MSTGPAGTSYADPAETPYAGAAPTAPTGPVRSPRPPRQGARRRFLLAALLPLTVLPGAALCLSGCGSPAEVRSAGPTVTASAPARLWPERKAATVPAAPHVEPNADPVPGVATVASGNIRDVRPLDVVKAEVKASAGQVSGADALDEETRRRIGRCTADASGAPAAGCPLRPAQYHDLTGDGRDDLILGIDLSGEFGAQLSLRAYTLDHGRLTRILSTVVTPLSIEVAGRDLIVREPTVQAGYETRSIFGWDEDQRALAFRGDEVRKVGPSPSSGTTAGGPPEPVPTAPPSPGRRSPAPVPVGVGAGR
ncbi:hypothetical protein [Streptomyces sp. URMC 123]|uniref:hypothetical protein n=1 Tax=Streptomyces sp. URMC 123 TaxID=3423403 RepID=UPI003F1A07EC